MEKLLYELPIERYVELYTSLKTAQEFKTFEDSIIKQPSLSTFISDKNILCLNWCIIDADDWTGLAIHYQTKQNDIMVNEGIYYDDSIYSYALKGLQRWSDIIQLSISF